MNTSHALHIFQFLSTSLLFPPSWNLLHYSNLLQTFIHECTERAKRERESRSKNRLRISGRSQEGKKCGDTCEEDKVGG